MDFGVGCWEQHWEGAGDQGCKGLWFGEDWEKEDSTLALSVSGSSSIYPDKHLAFACFTLVSGLLFSVFSFKSSFDTVSLEPSSGFIVPLDGRAQ